MVLSFKVTNQVVQDIQSSVNVRIWYNVRQAKDGVELLNIVVCFG